LWDNIAGIPAHKNVEQAHQSKIAHLHKSAQKLRNSFWHNQLVINNFYPYRDGKNKLRNLMLHMPAKLKIGRGRLLPDSL